MQHLRFFFSFVSKIFVFRDVVKVRRWTSSVRTDDERSIHFDDAVVSVASDLIDRRQMAQNDDQFDTACV